jgi:hypothetical protein
MKERNEFKWLWAFCRVALSTEYALNVAFNHTLRFFVKSASWRPGVQRLTSRIRLSSLLKNSGLPQSESGDWRGICLPSAERDLRGEINSRT